MATGDRKVPTPLLQVYNGLPVVRNMIWKQLLMYRIPPPPAVRVDHAAYICGVARSWACWSDRIWVWL